MILKELLNHHEVDYDNPKALDRYIAYTGEGFYSFRESKLGNKGGAYIEGIFPTYSRIKVSPKKDISFTD